MFMLIREGNAAGGGSASGISTPQEKSAKQVGLSVCVAACLCVWHVCLCLF